MRPRTRVVLVVGLLLGIFGFGISCWAVGVDDWLTVDEETPHMPGGWTVSGIAFEHDSLTVPFQIVGDGSLVIGISNLVEEIRDPSESQESLFLKCSDGSIEITSLKQLSGRVKIRTAKEALAFCRLASSWKTWYLLDEYGAEITSKNRVDLAFCFGDKDDRKMLREPPYGCFGIVPSDRTLNRFGISPTSVRRTSRGFEVRRSLLWYDLHADQARCVRVKELVGFDGSYERRQLSIRRLPHAHGVHWFMPFFM